MPGPEPIGEILSRLFTLRGWGRKQGRLQLEKAWTDVAGPELAEMTRVGGIRRGILEVEVAHAVLLQELAHYQKRQLLEKLQEKLPNSRIQDLRFRAGAWKP